MNEMTKRELLKLFVVAPASLAAANGLTTVQNAAEVSEEQIERAKRATKDEIERFNMPGYLEIRDHALYDSMRIPAVDDITGMPLRIVPERYHFFAMSLGQTAPGSWSPKTLVDTNMHISHCLPPPQSQLVNRILFLFSPAMAESDRARLIERYYFEFTLGSKVVSRAPMARCPVVGDISAVIAAGKRKLFEIEPHIGIHLERPIKIESGQFFSLVLHGRPFEPEAPITIYALLDGVGGFAVQ